MRGWCGDCLPAEAQLSHPTLRSCATSLASNAAIRREQGCGVLGMGLVRGDLELPDGDREGKEGRRERRAAGGAEWEEEEAMFSNRLVGPSRHGTDQTTSRD